jgi:hypothetical protein
MSSLLQRNKSNSYSFLEEALENGTKKSVPARSRSDSPKSPDNKRSKLDEQVQNYQTAEGQIKHLSCQKEKKKAFKTISHLSCQRGREKESIQNHITPILPKESVQTGVARGYAESAANTRVAQARLIESFERKRDERLEEMKDKSDDLRLDSHGDIVDITSSRSQSAQTASSALSHRSSSSSLDLSDQKETIAIAEDGGCQRDFRGRNRRIPEKEEYKTPRSDHYTDVEYDTQAIEAWRHYCRRMHDYMPDRDYYGDVHAKHLRILQAAIRDFKI